MTTLLLDLILIANPLVMVAVSSYESYISRIDAAGLTNKPKWLGKLDSGRGPENRSLRGIAPQHIDLLPENQDFRLKPRSRAK